MENKIDYEIKLTQIEEVSQSKVKELDETFNIQQFYE